MKAEQTREAWNKGKLVGQKPPLRLKDVWAIRIYLQNAHAVRDLAVFNLAIDSKASNLDNIYIHQGRSTPTPNRRARAQGAVSRLSRRIARLPARQAACSVLTVTPHPLPDRRRQRTVQRRRLQPVQDGRLRSARCGTNPPCGPRHTVSGISWRTPSF